MSKRHKIPFLSSVVLLSVTAASTKGEISRDTDTANDHVCASHWTLDISAPLRTSSRRQNLWRGTITTSLLEESDVLIGLKFHQWGTSQGPELPRALPKWEGNTIKCQDQLNCRCTSFRFSSLFLVSCKKQKRKYCWKVDVSRVG